MEKESSKGVDYVALATLYASRIILGVYEYKNVPAILKPKVKQVLEEQGLGELAE